ncbi:hypothetical protein Tsubulata_002576 [Turnera subulata]|uniref:Protein RALF-like 32 n=1 Tax=Turnera subulata TaxID=218843 RepID=A0A9Q0GAD7_9ROSI|nr:hypothetical protein Tsubulata_002576 [Turnera subulata]
MRFPLPPFTGRKNIPHYSTIKCFENKNVKGTAPVTNMEPKSLHFFFFLVTLILVYMGKMGTSSTLSSRVCHGSIAQCNEEFEFLMESDISRRFLEDRGHISYGALHRDQPACREGERGQSYSSSCLPPPSNAPSRGCSRIYRCRSDD